MRAFISILIAVVMAGLLVPGAVVPAGAEVVVSVKGGLFWMEKDKYTTHDTGFNYGFSLQYLPPIENRTIDVGIEYMAGTTRRNYPGGSVSPPSFGTPVNGNLRFDAIIGTAHYRPPISTSIQPYIGGGVGMYLTNCYYSGNQSASVLPCPTQSRTGWNFDAGVDFRLGPHWIVGMEYRYVLANMSAGNNTPLNSWLSNLNFMTTTGAIRYAF